VFNTLPTTATIAAAAAAAATTTTMNMYQMMKRKKGAPIEPFLGLEGEPETAEATFEGERGLQQQSKSMKEAVNHPLISESSENGGKEKRKSVSSPEIPLSSQEQSNSSSEERSLQRALQESLQIATQNVPSKDFFLSLVEEVGSSAPTHGSIGELVFEPNANGGNTTPRNATPPPFKWQPKEIHTPEQQQEESEEIRFSPPQVKAVALCEDDVGSDDDTYIRDEHYEQQPKRNIERNIEQNDDDDEEGDEFAAEYYRRHLAKSIHQSHDQNPAQFVQQGLAQYSNQKPEEYSPKKSQPVRFREDIDVSYAPSYEAPAGNINRFSPTQNRMDSTVSRYQNAMNDNASVYDDGLSVCDTVYTQQTFTHAYPPTSTDLMDPNSFDVNTYASMDDETVMDDATVVEDEAFKGELWTRMQKKKSVMKPTVDGGDTRVQTKYNKYRDLQTSDDSYTTNIRQSNAMRQSMPVHRQSTTRRQPRRESTGDSSMQLASGARNTTSAGILNVGQGNRSMEQRQSGIQDMYENVDKRISTMNTSNAKDMNFLREQLHHVRSSENPRASDGERESVLHNFTLAAPVRDNCSQRGVQTLQDVEHTEKKYKQKAQIGEKDMYHQRNG